MTDISNIPLALQALDRWIHWRGETRGGKVTKVPYRIDGGHARTNDPATWASFDAAVGAMSIHRPNLGFVFDAGDGLVGIDLDGCRNPETGNIDDWAREWLDKFTSYSEVSPSGTGVKVWIRGCLPGPGAHAKLDLPVKWGKNPGVEVYSTGRYFAVTGERLSEYPATVESADTALADFLSTFFPPRAPAAKPPKQAPGRGDRVEQAWAAVRALPDAVSGSNGHGATYHAACEAYRWGLSDAEATEIMERYNRSKTAGEAWTPKEMQHKLADARRVVETEGQYGCRLRPAAPDAVDVVDDTPEWTPFPVDLLPGVVARYVAAAARSLACDPSYVATPLLAALASAVGNSRRVAIKRTWLEPCILWGVVVGKSGTIKSPAHDLAVRPIMAMQTSAFSDHKLAMEGYARDKMTYDADVAEWKRTGRKTGVPPPSEPLEPVPVRHVVDDTTVAALAPILAAQPRGVLLARDELAAWFGSFDEFTGGRGGDAAKWLQMHGGRAVTVDRKASGAKVLHVPRAAVSIAGTIQPATLRRSMAGRTGREFLDNGMAARCLFAMPPISQKRWTEDDIPPAIEAALEQLFERLLALPMDEIDGELRPVDIPLAPAALAIWRAFVDAHGAEQATLPDDLSAAWSKLEGGAARFALLFHLVRAVCGEIPADTVGEEEVLHGIALARWFAGEAVRVYAVLGAATETAAARERRELLRLMREHGGRMRARALMRSAARYRGDAAAADAALMTLVHAGLARQIVDDHAGRAGRPATLFELLENGIHFDTIDEKPEKNAIVSPNNYVTGGLSHGANPVACPPEEWSEWTG